jgi:hypothetical protein
MPNAVTALRGVCRLGRDAVRLLGRHPGHRGRLRLLRQRPEHRPQEISTGSLGCEAENIVSTASISTGLRRAPSVTWTIGASAARRASARGPSRFPTQGVYLFRFAYVGIGGDVRAIDQDNRLNLRGDDFSVIKSSIASRSTRPMPAPTCRSAANTTSSAISALADRGACARSSRCVRAFTTPARTTRGGAHYAQARCGVRGPAAAHLQPAAE